MDRRPDMATSRKCQLWQVRAAYGSESGLCKPLQGVFMSHALV
jgi:hypothetical protein